MLHDSWCWLEYAGWSWLEEGGCRMGLVMLGIGGENFVLGMLRLVVGNIKPLLNFVEG